jgi:Xaa-Pro aminopeptidase
LPLESADAFAEQLRALKIPTEHALLRRAAQIAGVGCGRGRRVRPVRPADVARRARSVG